MNFNYSHKKKPGTGDFEIIITGDEEAWNIIKTIRMSFQDAVHVSIEEIIKIIGLSQPKNK